ncbi:MAG TPA: hypothetical protein VGA06_00280 [Candidatus Paceibacterota bacterium]
MITFNELPKGVLFMFSHSGWQNRKFFKKLAHPLYIEVKHIYTTETHDHRKGFSEVGKKLCLRTTNPEVELLETVFHAGTSTCQ